MFRTITADYVVGYFVSMLLCVNLSWFV